MALKVTSSFPGGNACAVKVSTGGEMPEIHFAADPCGGAESLWFYLRIEESQPDPAKHQKIRLVWEHVETVTGMPDAPACVPVSMGPGPTWSRMKQGDETRTADGRRQLTWTLPHPAPFTEVAFCFPYGLNEWKNLEDRTRDYWQVSTIGVSQSGHPILRAANHLGAAGSNHPGIVILARQHAGETPASWVLDGLMRYWSQARRGGYVIWVVPFMDIDGVQWGHYGRDGFPLDMDRAWHGPGARHETRVVLQDIQRWRQRCRPVLALDLRATGAAERDGVVAVSGDPTAPTAAEETKWSNTFKTELTPAFAAADFKRAEGDPGRHDPATSFTAVMRNVFSIPSLRLHIPYGYCGQDLLTQKSYRDIGQRIGQALHRRNG